MKGKDKPKRNHQRPNSHLLRSLPCKESLNNHGITNSNTRINEECIQQPSHYLCPIRVCFRIANIADQGAESRNQPNGPTTVAIGDRLPEQWRDTENEDLN